MRYFSMQNSKILIVDDNEDVLKALSALLSTHGFTQTCLKSPKSALNYFDTAHVDLALIDLNYSRDTTSGREGLNLISEIRNRDRLIPIVVMTAFGSIDLAIEVIKSGANDFIEKPWDNNRLLNILKTQLSLRDSKQRENSWLDENKRQIQSDSSVYLARSPAMQKIMTVVEKIAKSDANILITGEHGTGKSQLAKLIHGRSTRVNGPFINVNIGSLSDPLFESELFGHVKGAYTDAQQSRDGRFKLAHGGTLFLDEIGNLGLDLQAKLLRTIESGEFEPMGSSVTERSDIRLISATNADLNAMTAEGKFRQDLQFRLNTFELKLPPLRDRLEDVPDLARHFLDRLKTRYHKPDLTLGPEAIKLLKKHPWPGNVRELDHILQRAVLLVQGAEITAEDLQIEDTTSNTGSWLDQTFEEVEIQLIRHALAHSHGNIKKAAEKLGIGRNALYRRMEKYHISS